MIATTASLRPSVTALESLLAQSTDRFELVMALGHEAADAESFIASVRERTGIDPLVAHAAQPGLAQALNAAAGAARGRYIAFLIADDTYAPDRLAVFERAEQALPEFGWGFSGVEGSNEPAAKAADPDLQRAIELSQIPLEAVRALPHVDSSVTFGNLIIQVGAFQEVGGFRDSRYFMGWELALRLLEASAPYIAERVLYVHRPRPTPRREREVESRYRERALLIREHRRRVAATTTFSRPGFGAGIGSSRDALDPDDEFAVKSTLWAMERLRSAPRLYGLTRRAVRVARSIRARR